MKQAMGFRFLGLQICRRMKINMIKLGDVATYINGYAFKPEDRGVVGLPIIRIQDLTGSAYDLGFYDGDYPKRIEINDGDVLISWSASLGVYVWNGGRALLNQHIFKVQFDKADIDKRYFVYAVRQKLAELTMKTHGATMKHIVKKDFEETSIPYPSQKKQIEIGINLDKIANIIAARKQQLELLDELVKARFVEMFGDVIHNDRKWECKQFSDITTSRLGKMLDTKHQTGTCKYPYLANFNVQWFRFELGNLNEMDFNEKEREEFCLEDGDLLVCEGGEIGRCAVWHNQIKKCFFQKALHRVRCNQDIILPDYLSWWFKYNCENGGFTAIEDAKATISHLTGTKMKMLDVTVPPIKLQEQFVDIIHQVDKSKSARNRRYFIVNKRDEIYNSIEK